MTPQGFHVPPTQYTHPMCPPTSGAEWYTIVPTEGVVTGIVAENVGYNSDVIVFMELSAESNASWVSRKDEPGVSPYGDPAVTALAPESSTILATNYYSEKWYALHEKYWGQTLDSSPPKHSHLCAGALN
jgi:hypothetical protein